MPALSNPKHERFYVYVVRVSGRTRYVGKGTGRRAQGHLTKSHNVALAAEIATAKALGEPVRVRIIQDGLTERRAYQLERRLIWKWSSRLTNIAMGSHSAAEHVAMAARANIRTLKSEDQVRREGPLKGVSADQRVATLQDILAGLERLSRAA